MFVFIIIIINYPLWSQASLYRHQHQYLRDVSYMHLQVTGYIIATTGKMSSTVLVLFDNLVGVRVNKYTHVLRIKYKLYSTRRNYISISIIINKIIIHSATVHAESILIISRYIKIWTIINYKNKSMQHNIILYNIIIYKL